MTEKSLEIIKQLTDTLIETTKELEEAYNNKDLERFKKIKKEMIEINNKILENTK